MARGGQKHIYAIRAVGGQGVIKIGCSKLTTRRLMQISIWSPVPLELVATVPCGHGDERRLHIFLAESYSHNEWFFPTPEVMRVVSMMKAGASITDIFSTFDRCPFPRLPRGGQISRKGIRTLADAQHILEEAA